MKKPIDQQIVKLENEIEYYLRVNFKDDEKYFLATEKNKRNMARYIELLKTKIRNLQSKLDNSVSRWLVFFYLDSSSTEF